MIKLTKTESMRSGSHLLKKEYNTDNMIDKARLAQKEGNFFKALHFLDLVIMNKSTEIQNKILAYGIKSFIYTKIGRNDLLRKIASKFLNKYSESYFSQNAVDIESENLYLKVLYRSGKEEIQLNNLYLGCMMLWKANFYASRIEQLDSRKAFHDELNASYTDLLNKISIELKQKEEEIKDEEHKIKLINLKKDIIEEINRSYENSNSKFYAISTIWLNSLIHFISKLEENALSSTAFSRQVVLKQYFNISLFNVQKEECIGCYPGPINNYFLVDFKRGLNKETIFMKTNLAEKEDYILINEQIYSSIQYYPYYNILVEDHLYSLRVNLID